MTDIRLFPEPRLLKGKETLKALTLVAAVAQCRGIAVALREALQAIPEPCGEIREALSHADWCEANLDALSQGLLEKWGQS